MAEQYIYAVSRIRGAEMRLLNNAFLEQLLAAEGEEQCLSLLQERGWGEAGMESEDIFAQEEQKTWKLMKELVEDLSVFDVFLLENDFHNLKAAVKETCTGGHHDGIYCETGTIPYDFMEKALASGDYSRFPDYMQAVAKEAMEVLLKTRDGQLCDCLIDKAALETIRRAGKQSGSELMALYGELKTAAGNINIAVRGCRGKKDRQFLGRILAECDTLDKDVLAAAAGAGEEALYHYLERTAYADAIDRIKESVAAFEQWGDNLLIRHIHPQIHNPFGIDPLAAYILARRNEIRTVRIILTGKRNDLPEEVIRGRVREMYV